MLDLMFRMWTGDSRRTVRWRSFYQYYSVRQHTNVRIRPECVPMWGKLLSPSGQWIPRGRPRLEVTIQLVDSDSDRKPRPLSTPTTSNDSRAIYYDIAALSSLFCHPHPIMAFTIIAMVDIIMVSLFLHFIFSFRDHIRRRHPYPPGSKPIVGSLLEAISVDRVRRNVQETRFGQYRCETLYLY